MKLKKIYLFISIIILLTNLYSCAKSKENSKEKIIEKSIAIPFKLTDHNNISIETVIGGLDTLNLMFHTAESTVTLTTKATEKTKSIQWDAQTEVRSWGGKAASRYSANNSIDIKSIHIDSLDIWEDVNSGPTTDGKFGPNLFDGYALEIDYDNNVIRLYDSLPKKTKDFSKMNIITENGHLFIEGTSMLAGVAYKNKFLIHSGYGGAIMFDDKFAQESNIGEQIDIIDEQELKDSFGNVVKIKKGVLPMFKIGNLELTNVPVGFFQGKIGRQQMSITGGDLLKRFNIILDAKREHMYLKESGLKNNEYTKF